MASSISYNVYIPSGTIPTAATKIKLADQILVSPLSEQQTIPCQHFVSCIHTIVLGTSAWGDKRLWNWTDERNVTAKEAFDMSISKGINTFDTAEVYGNGERYVDIDDES